MKNNVTKSSKVLEVRPGVFFPIPTAARGLSFFLRRLKQLYALAFSKHFSPYRNFEEDIKNRYSDQREIDFYTAIALSGFYKEEYYAVKEAMKSMPETPTAIVIGSGTGREAFALEDLGFSVVGLDNCPRMNEISNGLAQEKGKVSNFQEYFPSQKAYDLVYTTFSLTNHIPAREDRINFLNQMKELMHDRSILLFGGYFRPIHFGDRFWIAHLILKLRWLFRRKLEKGTTAISHLGHHNDESLPILFHFYQSGDEIQRELIETGLDAKMIEIPKEEFSGGLDNFWVAKKKPT